MNPMKTVDQVRMTSPLFSGLVYALIMMTIGTLITSFFLLLTSTQESSLPTLTAIIHALSLFIGGWAAGKRAGKQGWYYGSMLSVMYFTLVFIVGFLAFDAGFNWHSIQLFAILLVSSVLGGILGVNTRK